MRTAHFEGSGTNVGSSAGLRVFANTVIQDNGQLKIYRSQTNSPNCKCIEIFRPITGQGNSASDARVLVNLPYSPPSGSMLGWGNIWGNNGVNFDGYPQGMGEYPGALPIVNGSGDYGLRVEGKAEYLTNFLYAIRVGCGSNALTGITGSGGTFTVAVTDGETIDINDGPSSGTSIYLGIASGSNPKYVLSGANLANFNGLVHKGGTAIVRDGTTVTMKTLKLAASAGTIQLGEVPGSGAVLKFDNSSAVAWNAGTLTISNWNGSASGGGPDQIKFGTDATGLTTAQLTQVKWINPFGGGDIAGAKILATGEIVPTAPAVTEIKLPRIVSGSFVFDVVPAVPTQTNVVEWATNLAAPVTWTPVRTNTGAFSFTNALTVPKSFYRVWVR